MLVQELQILSQALWEAIKVNAKFFAPIQLFVKKLSELDYSDLSHDNIAAINLYAKKVEDFFNGYRATGQGFYIPPNETGHNDDTVKRIYDLANQLANLDEAALDKERQKVKPEPKRV